MISTKILFARPFIHEMWHTNMGKHRIFWALMHALSMQEGKALTRLRICAVSSEPLLLAGAISTKIVCAGPYANLVRYNMR